MIEPLPVCLLCVGALGTLTSLLLYRWACAANRAVNLNRHYRDGDPGCCDLLNYAALVEAGVVACKNGALLAAYEYRGEDHSGLSDEQREVTSHLLGQALAKLGSGWLLHFDCLRGLSPAYPAAGKSHFPDRVSAAIDQERREAFEGAGAPYATRLVVSFTYLPPSELERRASGLLYVGEDEAGAARPLERARQVLERFKKDLKTLEDRFSSVMSLRRLESRGEFNELLEHLHRCITGVAQPIRTPAQPLYLDAQIGGQDFFSGRVPRVGAKHLAVVAIEGFPSGSHPGILHALESLELEYRWSTRWICLEPWEALAHLEDYRRKWKLQTLPMLGWLFRFGEDNVDQDAEAMVKDVDAAKAGVNAGQASAGYYNSAVVLYDEDFSRLQGSARAVEKAIRNLGFVPRWETVNAVEAYLSTLPSHGVENVRRPLLHTANLADLVPLSSIWTGRKTCPCPPPFYPPHSPPLALALTEGRAAFYLNLHVGELPHTLVFGPTKAGKSTLLAFLAVSFRRYPRMTIWIFDKGFSLYALCQAVGGDHYRIAADDCALCFAPLSYLSSPVDRAWALSWLELALALNGLDVTPDQQNEIAAALESMQKRGHRSLSDFCSEVSDKAIRAALRQYTVDGTMGHLFDAEEDGLDAFSAFTVFEMQEAYSLEEKFRLPLLWYLFRRVEKNLRGQPAAVIIDEAKNSLDNDHFRKKIEVWLREMRKANCAVILATQGLSDAAGSGIFHTLNESTATKIFLANSAAQNPDARALYERFGLNPQQIRLIGEAIPKRDYYLVNEDGCRLFELALSPLALAFCGVSDKDSVAEVQRLVAAHGPGWIHPWLSQKGLCL